MSSAAAPRARASSPNPANKKDDDKTPPAEAKKEESKGGLFTPKTIGICAAVVVVLGILYKVVGDKVDMKKLMEDAVAYVEASGDNGLYIYLAITLIGVCCLIPTTPMEIAGGFLFSPKYGMVWVLVYTGTAKLIANCISVLIARYIVKDWVMKNVVAKNELLTMVSKAVAEEPWKMAFLVRGSMVPLFVKNYGLGVMDIDFLPIAVNSSIFTNFYAFQNIYMGSTLQNLKEVFAPKKGGGDMDMMGYVKKFMPIVFNVLLIVLLVKAVKGQIKKQKAAIEKDLKSKEGKKDS